MPADTLRRMLSGVSESGIGYRLPALRLGFRGGVSHGRNAMDGGFLSQVVSLAGVTSCFEGACSGGFGRVVSSWARGVRGIGCAMKDFSDFAVDRGQFMG